jgi:hypothetical protein
MSGLDFFIQRQKIHLPTFHLKTMAFVKICNQNENTFWIFIELNTRNTSMQYLR